MSSLGTCALNTCAFKSQYYIGIWQDALPFTYEAGATVYITASMVASIPMGTKVLLYCSEDSITWTQINLNQVTYVTFTSSFSGSSLLYVKLELYSYNSLASPIITSLNIFIHQETSLYTIAIQVLSDGLTSRNVSWNVDTELQKYKIPYAWLKTMTHRKALAQISEAAGGVAYQDRNGIIRIEAGNYIERKEGGVSVDTINEDRIFEMSSPVAAAANKVQITTLPYVAQSNQVIWTLSGTNTLVAGEQKTYNVNYSDWEAVIDATASLTGTGASIIASVYRFGGADITISASVNVTITLNISGKPLKIVGSQVVTETDGDSIRRYGIKILSINENNLIQSTEISEAIAEDIINITKNPNRNIEILWRGDPTDELGDIVKVIDNNAVIVSQEFELSGNGFNTKTKLRRLG